MLVTKIKFEDHTENEKERGCKANLNGLVYHLIFITDTDCKDHGKDTLVRDHVKSKSEIG